MSKFCANLTSSTFIFFLKINCSRDKNLQNISYQCRAWVKPKKVFVAFYASALQRVRSLYTSSYQFFFCEPKRGDIVSVLLFLSSGSVQRVTFYCLFYEPAACASVLIYFNCAVNLIKLRFILVLSASNSVHCVKAFKFKVERFLFAILIHEIRQQNRRVRTRRRVLTDDFH